MAPEHYALRFRVLMLRGWGPILEEPEKCLKLSLYLPLLMSELRGLGCWIAVCPPPRSFMSDKWWSGQSFTSLHKWHFHYFGCEVGHLLDIFFYIFSKALHMRGFCQVFVKHLTTFPLNIRKQNNKINKIKLVGICL